jgi:hypothetical protein
MLITPHERYSDAFPYDWASSMLSPHVFVFLSPAFLSWSRNQQMEYRKSDSFSRRPNPPILSYIDSGP